MTVEIKQDNLSDPRVHALIRTHVASAHALTPPESTHAFDIESLRDPSITVWTLWEGDELLGCGALKLLSADDKAGHFGEVKSMHTYEKFRGRGLGAMMLAHIIEFARKTGYSRLSLETGQPPGYTAARALYKKFGFTDCAPFAHYKLDPHSTFMTLSV